MVQEDNGIPVFSQVLIAIVSTTRNKTFDCQQWSHINSLAISRVLHPSKRLFTSFDYSV